MKRFNFRLERVLRFRETELDEAKAALIAERATLATLEEDLRLLREAHDRFSEVVGVVSGRDVLLQGWIGEGVKLRIELLDERISRQRLRVEECLGVYRERQQGVRVLEKLREKHKEEYKIEVHRQETAELDELGVAMRQRNRDGK
jgi:flagellar export protein FliJ